MFPKSSRIKSIPTRIEPVQDAAWNFSPENEIFRPWLRNPTKFSDIVSLIFLLTNVQSDIVPGNIDAVHFEMIYSLFSDDLTAVLFYVRGSLIRIRTEIGRTGISRYLSFNVISISSQIKATHFGVTLYLLE